MKTILVSGANGFIASNFIKKFALKYNFVKISQRTHIDHLDLVDLSQNPDLIRSVDCVINLAGANIGERLWSKARKNELINSRKDTTQKLVDLFNKYNPDAHFISASAVGIYPEIQDNDEDTPIDYKNFATFSEEVTKTWEQEALNFRGHLAITRFGVVFAGTGGAFPKMLKPFKMFVGGELGHGQQHLPWIALPDLLNALDYLIENHKSGVYNLVAPELITNHQLSTKIASIWKRPSCFGLPSAIIRFIFGQMGQELFLADIKVIPKNLSNEKFDYNYPKLTQCLIAIHKSHF